MLAWLLAAVPRKVLIWGAVAVGAVAAVAVYLWRRDARVAAGVMDRITAAARERELNDRRIKDDVDADVAGLSDRERRDRLRQRWTRN